MRSYKGGRSTLGWHKSKRITSLNEIKRGMVLITVSHQFHAQNLIRVTSVNKLLDGFNYIFVTPDNKKLHEREMYCHGFTLRDTDSLFTEEYYITKRNKNVKAA